VDFKLPAPFVDALETIALVQAPDQGLHSDHDAVAVRGHRLCGPVRGVHVQEKILAI
jgi:hypothetical protein